MADNVAVTAGSGTTIAADEVSDGSLGSCKVQYVKLMDGTLDGTTKATVGSAGLKVDPSGVSAPVALATDVIYNGTTSVAPIFVQTTTSLTATQIVASTSGKKIRVMNGALFGNGAVNAKWTASTNVDLTPIAPVGSNFGYVLPYSPIGWFETTVGSALGLNLSASQINVGVHIAYVLI